MRLEIFEVGGVHVDDCMCYYIQYVFVTYSCELLMLLALCVCSTMLHYNDSCRTKETKCESLMEEDSLKLLALHALFNEFIPSNFVIHL